VRGPTNNSTENSSKIGICDSNFGFYNTMRMDELQQLHDILDAWGEWTRDMTRI
jgi:hypothetical protein